MSEAEKKAQQFVQEVLDAQKTRDAEFARLDVEFMQSIRDILAKVLLHEQHVAYLLRDLEAEAVADGIDQTHPAIFERICELRRFVPETDLGG